MNAYDHNHYGWTAGYKRQLDRLAAFAKEI